MVDNNSSRFYSVGNSGFNFKGGDISGTAAKSQDDKMDGNEYFAQGDGEGEEVRDSRYVDRSAQLRATLNSLAMMNVASVINKKYDKKITKKSQKADDEDLDDEIVDDLDESDEIVLKMIKENNEEE